MLRAILAKGYGMAKTQKPCFICTNSAILDTHHIVPVEYGGEECGRTVDICPSCHRQVHRCAELSYAAKTKPNGTGYLPKTVDVETVLRFNVIAGYIYNAKMLHEQSGKSMADTARNMLQISLDKDTHTMLHELKHSMHLRSIERVVITLIHEAYLKTRGR